MFISVVWKYSCCWFIVNIYIFCCALVWDVEIRRVDAEPKTTSYDQKLNPLTAEEKAERDHGYIGNKKKYIDLSLEDF